MRLMWLKKPMTCTSSRIAASLNPTFFRASTSARLISEGVRVNFSVKAAMAR